MPKLSGSRCFRLSSRSVPTSCVCNKFDFVVKHGMPFAWDTFAAIGSLGCEPVADSKPVRIGLTSS